MTFRIGVDIRLLNVPRHTGICRYLSNQVRELAALTTEEYLFIGDPRGQNLPPEVKLRKIDLPMNNSLSGQQQLSLVAWMERVDLLFCPYFIPPQRRHCPAVLTVADLIPLRHPEWFASPEVGEFFQNGYRAACENAEHLIAVSAATKADLIEYYHLPQEKISVVLDAADPIFSQPDDDLPLPLAGNLPIARPYILSVCTLEPRKNLSRTIAAYRELREENRQEKPLLILAGGLGWHYDEILAEIDNSGYREDIRLTGYVEDRALARLYRRARMFVYPSLYEGFGLPVVEAMAAGTPVITADNSSLPEVGGDAVLYCNALEKESIAHSMQRLLDDDSLHQHCREKGFAQAAHFSWQKTAEQTRKVFLQTLGETS